VPGVDVAIWRPDGSVCDPGETGEVVARGPNLMDGYWNKPEATAAVLRDGWYRTGDLGYMDDERFVFIVDRATDMIISGAENVYSVEVEDAVMAHPAVVEVAVIGVPDDYWGERVHAVVVLTDGATLELDELQDFCRARIAGFKLPRSLSAVEALPKSGAGKILKRELREAYWGSENRRVH
jgi:acyl-CoA synthetase (AMP-forming)/AMP-acid ligase II